MEYIRVTKDNLEKEHIRCAISSNHDIQVLSKKNWLRDRFAEGLVFLKSTERSKCFIEYIPAENSRNPIIADGEWSTLYAHGVSCGIINRYLYNKICEGLVVR